MPFAYNLRTTSYFRPKNMNRLGYIIDGDNLYCAVRTGYLNGMSRFTLKESNAISQAVNGWPVTTETRVPIQVIPCPFRYLQSGIVTRYSNVIPPVFHINLCLYVDLMRRAKGQAWEHNKQQRSVGNQRAFDRNSFYVMLTSKMHFLN